MEWLSFVQCILAFVVFLHRASIPILPSMWLIHLVGLVLMETTGHFMSFHLENLLLTACMISYDQVFVQAIIPMAIM